MTTPLPVNVSKIKEEIKEVFNYIYANPELSSEESKSSKFLVKKISEFCDVVQKDYLGMETSFMAKIGNGNPKVCLFAEYDALPIGHACGHNIIAAWAFGVFKSLSMEEHLNGTVYIFGSPAEEGRGKYASSKIKIGKEAKKLGINGSFVIHPYNTWAVSGQYFARWRNSFIFHGKESHAAGAPNEGINALDAAVNFYLSCKMIRSTLDNTYTTVISEIIADGGKAVNIIPERAEVIVDVRSSGDAYIESVTEKILVAAKASASSNGCTLDIKQLAPVTSTFKKNPEMDNIFYKSTKKYVPNILSLEQAKMLPAIGSSDVGDLSHSIPTSQLLVGITEDKIGLHTQEFLRIAGTSQAEESLLYAVASGYDAVKSFLTQFDNHV